MNNLEQYLDNQNIRLIYNTLGNTEKLRKLFVIENELMLNSSDEGSSYYIKHEMYSKYYHFEKRNKLTGFEKVKHFDRQVRNFLDKYFEMPKMDMMDNVESGTSSNGLDYKTELINSLKSISNPLIYYSGGIDSEFVMLAAIDSGISFKTVIFQFHYNGETVNQEELDYAFKFCQSRNIQPLIKNIDLTDLWLSDDFETLASTLNMNSPHQLTHLSMVLAMNQEMPGHTHLFGGEVRFLRSQIFMDKSVNLVYTAKVNPPGFNGSFYTATNNPGGRPPAFNYIDLSMYFNSNGTWQLERQFAPSIANVFASGNWTNTPAVANEYQVINSNITQSSGFIGAVTYTIGGGTTRTGTFYGPSYNGAGETSAITPINAGFNLLWRVRINFTNFVNVQGTVTIGFRNRVPPGSNPTIAAGVFNWQMEDPS